MKKEKINMNKGNEPVNAEKKKKPSIIKQYTPIIIGMIVALGIGLGLGYVLFSGEKSEHTSMPDEHQHDKAAPASDEVWICSMHPQIRQNEFGICPICEMDLIPAESNTSNDPLVLQMTEEAVKLSNVQTSIIGEESGTSGKIINLTGKIKSDERSASSQVAHLPGRIEKLYVTFTGEQVVAGQKLADIYAPDLIAAQQELFEAQKLLDFNPSLLEAVRNKLRYWKINESTIRSIEQSGKIQKTFPLYAQESGVVSKKKVSVGDYVKQGEPLFELINLDKVWVLFDAYEEDLAEVNIGDRIEFTASTIPNKTFKSAITFINPTLNPETRTISLRTEISNIRGLLKPETLVYGELNKVRKTKGQLTVPKSAVMWTGRKSIVYVKLQDTEIPSFKYKEIEIGDEMGKSYQIIKGLERGEEVVTYGSFTIDAAAQLNNQASMMNRNVTQKKEEKGAPDFLSSTADEFKKQLNELVNDYIILKDALVETDANKAKISIGKFSSSLKKVDMSLVKGDAHIYWMEQHNAILTHSGKITETEDVEKQRTQFGFVSEAIVNALTAFGTIGEALYIQHCPMAFDNEGADWVSTEEAIKNPYFGDKMMKCGLVKKSFNVNQ